MFHWNELKTKKCQQVQIFEEFMFGYNTSKLAAKLARSLPTLMKWLDFILLRGLGPWSAGRLNFTFDMMRF